MFVDEAKILVRSGKGGAGAVSFRREKYIPRGGPDGGDGGRGGNVVFRVKSNVKTLSYIRMRQRFFAQNGRPGAGRNKTGSAGDDVVIEVPPGTVVTDLETGERLLDLVTEHQEAVLLQGGRGGKGNAHFKSSRHQTPRFSQPGEEGEERSVKVEIQVIADIGFVGLPNAGKSTLLKVLTAADPKIGNYPFTTVIPNLGVMHHFEQDVVLADIPGLIEGASDGAGLGTRFLKHIARTRGLAFVLDAGEPDMAGAFSVLTGELRSFSRDLPEKPFLVVVTKTDRLRTEEIDREQIDLFRQSLSPDVPVVEVSALARENLEALQAALVELALLPEKDSGDVRVDQVSREVASDEGPRAVAPGQALWDELEPPKD
ncbi:GTPase ObgE [Alkalispirochaeta sphaeroplastigenens]|uniref:GTPase ObgE n=1 Tax=Alkalispirochaeta sphaeroplastigenens TaxID=1187066 RepID=UPI0024823B54|nr:GTPase ObgE [Alkalispirochaeta sphaeroplastigenens]